MNKNSNARSAQRQKSLLFNNIKQPLPTLSEDELHQQFQEQLAKEFFSYENQHKPFTNSEQFLTHLLASSDFKKFHPILTQLKANTADDKYSTLTLKSENPLYEYQLKSTNAYGGPKVENYLERINIRIEAALAWAKAHDLSEEQMTTIRNAQTYFTKQILQDCTINHHLVIDQNYQEDNFVKDFNEKNKKARHHIADCLAVINHVLAPDQNDAKLLKELYYIEAALMSEKKRPTLINIRAMTLEAKNYIEINVVSPVKEIMTSSAKKDEAGMANWMKTENRIYEIDHNREELIFKNKIESMRSASIIPHEILIKTNLLKKLFGKGGLNKALAFESAKRNLSQEIIPLLAAEILKKNPNASQPLTVSYEMLTLISPISKLADRLLDPDLATFDAVREAFNRYQGREFDCTMPNGAQVKVKFEGIYHNYGANPGRGFPHERSTNMKAYNQIIDRSLATLPKANSTHLPLKLNGLLVSLNTIPVMPLKKITAIHDKLNHIYSKMDSLKIFQLSSNEYQRLMQLNAMHLQKKPFLASEKSEYQDLKAKFIKYQKMSKPLQRKANQLEKKSRQQHVNLAKKRKQFFEKYGSVIESTLANLEKTTQNADHDVKDCIQHLRALSEYAKLSKLSYDSLTHRIRYHADIAKKNEKNYAIQSYVEILNNFTHYAFHKTCKSGKDRTNAAEEKRNAKILVGVHVGKIPAFLDKKQADLEQQAVEKGICQGAGNKICGFNMPPGAQQLDQGDIFMSKTNLKIAKEVSILQKLKGFEKIKVNRKKIKNIAEQLAKSSEIDLNTVKRKKIYK